MFLYLKVEPYKCLIRITMQIVVDRPGDKRDYTKYMKESTCTEVKSRQSESLQGNG
jgi:hypothetical protein